MQRESYFQQFCLSDNHGKTFIDNGLPSPIKQCCVAFTRIYVLLPFHNFVNREGDDKSRNCRLIYFHGCTKSHTHKIKQNLNDVTGKNRDLLIQNKSIINH